MTKKEYLDQPVQGFRKASSWVKTQKESAYIAIQRQDLRECYAWLHGYKESCKHRVEEHVLKIEKEIAFQESVLWWVEILRRDGIVSTLKAIRDIESGLRQQGQEPQPDQMRSFSLATQFHKLDPRITEPFPR